MSSLALDTNLRFGALNRQFRQPLFRCSNPYVISVSENHRPWLYSGGDGPNWNCDAGDPTDVDRALDLQFHDSAPISRPVWKAAGVRPSSIGDAVMQRRRPDWRLATGLKLSRFTSHFLHICRNHAREQSWNGLGCDAILLMISNILGYRKVIHSEAIYSAGSIRVHMSPPADFLPSQAGAALYSSR